MFYVKNVPGWERTVRIIMGLALLAGALAWLGFTARGLIVGVSGVIAALTGMVGFCPMCALMGRKLDSNNNQ